MICAVDVAYAVLHAVLNALSFCTGITTSLLGAAVTKQMGVQCSGEGWTFLSVLQF